MILMDNKLLSTFLRGEDFDIGNMFYVFCFVLFHIPFTKILRTGFFAIFLVSHGIYVFCVMVEGNIRHEYDITYLQQI